MDPSWSESRRNSTRPSTTAPAVSFSLSYFKLQVLTHSIISLADLRRARLLSVIIDCLSRERRDQARKMFLSPSSGTRAALFQQSFTPTLIIASSIKDIHNDHSITPLSDHFSIALRLGESTLRFGRCSPSQVAVFYQRLIAICERFSQQVARSFSAISMQFSKGCAPIKAYWESRHSFLVYKALHSLSY